MADNSKKPGGELFIVDNADDQWKVQRYLHDWCDIARAFDIATGYFEIGSLLALDGQWQKLEKLRILMGDEVSKRTKKAFEAGLTQITGRLDDSIEAAKEEEDFLSGVPAIVEAIKSGQIQVRVYRKKKFHAKAYITHEAGRRRRGSPGGVEQLYLPRSPRECRAQHPVAARDRRASGVVRAPLGRSRRCHP